MLPSTLLGTALLVLGLADGPTPPAAGEVRASYDKLRAEATRDAGSQVALALWCESRGLTKERARHLAMAALADPENALARTLMGLVKDGDAWKPAEDVAAKQMADRLVEYRRRRAETRKTAAAQHDLALWCEAEGLTDEARAHWLAAVRIDSKHEASWKKLGRRKVDGTWKTEEQIAAAKADAEDQKEADRAWSERLRGLRGLRADLAVKDRREEAERALANVDDPRAVPAILRVFANGRGRDEARATQLLGQIDAKAASLALAGLAIHGESATARGMASRALQMRDPREFAAELIALLRKPIRFEVRPVGGPGEPGGLYIDGERVESLRVYLAPPITTNNYAGTGFVGYGPSGLPLVMTKREQAALRNAQSVPYPDTFGYAYQVSDADRQAAAFVSAMSGLSGTGMGIDAVVNPQLSMNFQDRLSYEYGASQYGDFSRSQISRNLLAQYEARTQLMIGEAMNAARVSQAQLEADIATLKGMNEQRAAVNRMVVDTLSPIAGIEIGEDPDRWKSWYVDMIGYRLPDTSKDQPTRKRQVVQYVNSRYEPQQFQGFEYSPNLGYHRTISCFGAGTMVRTREGLRAIETLEPGDMVLALDPATGVLGHQPIVKVHHNPPGETLVVRVGDEAIVSSTFHRFWVAGRGWIMARELKAGDAIRTVRGTATVEAITPGETVPVFNLDVADAATFFVGDSALLVHDNTLPDHRARPFDAIAASPR